MLAESFYRKYSCVGTSRRPNPLVCIVTLREEERGGLFKGILHDYQMFAEIFYRRYPCVGV
jgi:hypothetical protein